VETPPDPLDRIGLGRVVRQVMKYDPGWVGGLELSNGAAAIEVSVVKVRSDKWQLVFFQS
jgi:hypothetical protein